MTTPPDKAAVSHATVTLTGKTVRLRAVEPGDLDLMYEWENNPGIWSVSGTTAPFSRHTLGQFIENQQHDISETHQLRLIIETLSGDPVGMLDLYDYAPFEGRAGVGILICKDEDRGMGYASEALELGCGYARSILRMHQLWCCILEDNEASLALFRGAGFTQTGVKRQWSWRPDGYLDEIMMQKILGGGQAVCGGIQYEL